MEKAEKEMGPGMNLIGPKNPGFAQAAPLRLRGDLRLSIDIDPQDIY